MEPIRITDLDELVLTVRDRGSRSYILEAVNAYRGGAYRAAVISTWVAVTFDVIAKARELSSQGDANAKTFVGQLDHAISIKSIPLFQKFENELLEKARDEFEFLSTHEYDDLERLKSDRNLCAHPAFVGDDALYQPTPELVRAHLVHAVLHLLRHQPVQGKSALDRIANDLKSNSFPTDRESVQEFLNGRYLGRAKDSLIRNLIVVMLKDLFSPTANFDPKRVLNTLETVSLSHPRLYEAVMQDKLASIVGATADAELRAIFALMSREPRVWGWLQPPDRVRIKETLNTLDLSEGIGSFALKCLDIPELRLLILEALNRLDFVKRFTVIATHPVPQLVDTAISMFAEASSFRGAEELGKALLLPMANYFKPAHIDKILRAANENNQIYSAGLMPQILLNFFELTVHHLPLTKDSWRIFVEYQTKRQGDPKAFYAYPDLREKLTALGVVLDDALTTPSST